VRKHRINYGNKKSKTDPRPCRTGHRQISVKAYGEADLLSASHEKRKPIKESSKENYKEKERKSPSCPFYSAMSRQDGTGQN